MVAVPPLTMGEVEVAAVQVRLVTLLTPILAVTAATQLLKVPTKAIVLVGEEVWVVVQMLAS